MNLNLNHFNHHHPAQKKSVMDTLVNRAIKIADAKHVKKGMNAFWGKHSSSIVISPKKREAQEEELEGGEARQEKEEG